MNEQFQQAVVASRAGQTKEAQFLLAQSLQEEPNNADAWLLLSQLVDSKEKQQEYLAKAVALDPEHELANEYRVASGDDVVAVDHPVAEELDDMAELEAILDADVDDFSGAYFEMMSAISSPLPDLDDSDADMDDWLTAAVAADSVEDDDEIESFDAVESIDFAELMEDSDGAMDEEVEEKTAVDDSSSPPIEDKKEVEIEETTVKTDEKTAVVDSKTAKREKQAAQLNYMIYGLIAIAVLLVLYMAYLLIG